MMKIRVSKELCSGCRICEMVCSLFHTGMINPERSAIRIRKNDLGNGIREPVVCRRCRKMKCLEGEGAEESKEAKLFIWDQKRAEKCTFGALPVFRGEALHCDLCGGNPRCVMVCTTGALRVRESKKGGNRINTD
jgi:Fe-S-cluster-containing hydrogenase component 2